MSEHRPSSAARVTTFRGRGILLALGAVAATLLAVSAIGQTVGETDYSGSIVNVAATGGNIRAAGASVTVTGNADALDVAGASVNVTAAVKTKLRAAGGQVTVGSSVDGDLQAAGGVVEVRGGRVGGDAQLAGIVVKFDAPVVGKLQMAGTTIEVGSNAQVGGDLSAAGAVITVLGKVTGSSNLAGSAITFNGQAQGSVTVNGDEIVIGPAAVITGDLIVRSEVDAIVQEGATISGQVRREAPDHWWRFPLWLWRAGVAVIMAGGTILTGIILLLLVRRTFDDGVSDARDRPLSSGLIGLATLILLPAAAVALMVTVFGLSIGFAFLFLIPLILVCGHAVVATCMAAWVMDRTSGTRSVGWSILLLAIGAVVLALVGLIPWVGPLLVGLAILVGTGAFLRSAIRHLRRPPQPIPA